MKLIMENWKKFLTENQGLSRNILEKIYRILENGDFQQAHSLLWSFQEEGQIFSPETKGLADQFLNFIALKTGMKTRAYSHGSSREEFEAQLQRIETRGFSPEQAMLQPKIKSYASERRALVKIWDIIEADKLKQAGMKACGFMNCKIFVQEITNVAKIRDLPSKQFENEAMLLPGNILVWPNQLHYAIWLGDGQIMHVEEWGGDPKTTSLQVIVEEEGPPEMVYLTGGLK